METINKSHYQILLSNLDTQLKKNKLEIQLLTDIPQFIFRFEVPTVDITGQIVSWQNTSSKYFVQEIGGGVTLEMVQIPPGKFTMGSPQGEQGRCNCEEFQHEVTVPGFFMGKYQVTQEQYEAVMGYNPSYFSGKKRPVERVSWGDATQFCNRLSQITGRYFTLPSESQWEYACRAGSTTSFNFGNSIITDLANYNGNYSSGLAPNGVWRQETTEVGNFPPNAYGLYDMHGNVWEWCLDTWHENYFGSPTDGSAWVDSSTNFRVMRGGCWYWDFSGCRSASRNYSSGQYNINGFRVVCLGI
jgi:formylglycine-generating enzyme required for sulfatase activity